MRARSVERDGRDACREAEEFFAYVPGIKVRLAGHQRVQLGLKRSLEGEAKSQETGIPFPALIDIGEGAVVKLVAAIEGELEIVVFQRMFGPTRWKCEGASGPAL